MSQTEELGRLKTHNKTLSKCCRPIAHMFLLEMLSALAIKTNIHLQTKHPAIAADLSHYCSPNGIPEWPSRAGLKLTSFSATGHVPTGGGDHIWVWRNLCPCRYKARTESQREAHFRHIVLSWYRECNRWLYKGTLKHMHVLLYLNWFSIFKINRLL